VSANDVIFSNSGVKFGTTGKTYVALKMPFVTFYITNQGTGTAVVVFQRASDSVVLFATIIAAVSDADGNQAKMVTLPVDDVQGLTCQTTKTGTVSLTIVASGLTDSGLLPDPMPLPLMASRSQNLQIAGGIGGGSQTIGGGVIK
tara:strand:- start:745 stop:1179 length:435 start_codon:yes stop_codon:yes gene_type:complete